MSEWLGLDSSIAAFGWALMTRDTAGHPYVVGMGVWRTKPDPKAGKLADRASRVAFLGRQLLELLDTEQAGEALEGVYIESLALGMKTSRSTAQTLGRVRGLVEGICLARGLRLEEVRPEAVKQAVTGRRDASKEDVARMLARIYGVTSKELDATDALAVAHVGASRFGNAVKLSSGVTSYREDEEGLAEI